MPLRIAVIGTVRAAIDPLTTQARRYANTPSPYLPHQGASL